MKVTLWVVSIVFLSGCASAPKSVSISCFADPGAQRAKSPVEIAPPLIINDGTVIYYDESGQLNRMNKAVCGVQP